ncbi:MAG: hypothetical protein KJO73_09150, partial [Croceitalea sp.]|nr:hypothetical protein [Croceitalea sp.]
TLPAFPVNNGLEGAFNKDYFETDLIIETTDYPDNTDQDDQALWKDTYVYFNPRLTITSVIDDNNFEVSAADFAKLRVGAFLQVHSPDFSDISQEVTVSGLDSNIVTTNVALDYTPSINDQVDLVGFLDGGYPFRYF